MAEPETRQRPVSTQASLTWKRVVEPIRDRPDADSGILLRQPVGRYCRLGLSDIAGAE
jgi:hypothetical protein